MGFPGEIDDVCLAFGRLQAGLNAIYFKGDWASQFDKKHTREREFHVNPEEKVTVPMMFQKGKFRLAGMPTPRRLNCPTKATG